MWQTTRGGKLNVATKQKKVQVKEEEKVQEQDNVAMDSTMDNALLAKKAGAKYGSDEMVFLQMYNIQFSY